jgi:hypothetical protein
VPTHGIPEGNNSVRYNISKQEILMQHCKLGFYNSRQIQHIILEAIVKESAQNPHKRQIIYELTPFYSVSTALCWSLAAFSVS